MQIIMVRSTLNSTRLQIGGIWSASGFILKCSGRDQAAEMDVEDRIESVFKDFHGQVRPVNLRVVLV